MRGSKIAVRVTKTAFDVALTELEHWDTEEYGVFVMVCMVSIQLTVALALQRHPSVHRKYNVLGIHHFIPAPVLGDQ